MPNQHFYQGFYRPLGANKNADVDIALERRSKFAMLREAGFTVIVARRLRDWHWKDVIGQLDLRAHSEDYQTTH